MLRIFCITLFLLHIIGCSSIELFKEYRRQPPKNLRLVDPNATRETKVLYYNMKRLQGKVLLFGHQDDRAYGFHWGRNEGGRSDVKETTGAYPAVFGWDIASYTHPTINIDSVRIADMRRWIIEGYQMGAINTISWHLQNLRTGGGSWDTTKVLREMLPNGKYHTAYTAKLDTLATFFKSLTIPKFKRLKGKLLVPIIFRPFHENTGSWFWWGHKNGDTDDYIALWRFTVSYLRDVKGVHNLLYAYSTDIFNSKMHYLIRYPGDEYTDVLGYDDYWNLRKPNGVDSLAQRLRMLAEMAKLRDKVPALTETGHESLPDTLYWDRMYEASQRDSLTQQTLFFLVWRNENKHKMKQHFYAPYPDHPSAPAFRRFKKREVVRFASELPPLYMLMGNEATWWAQGRPKNKGD